jgi:hypothetical protein
MLQDAGFERIKFFTPIKRRIWVKGNSITAPMEEVYKSIKLGYTA